MQCVQPIVSTNIKQVRLTTKVKKMPKVEEKHCKKIAKKKPKVERKTMQKKATQINAKELRPPGLEPGTQAWKAYMLTPTPRTRKLYVHGRDVTLYSRILVIRIPQFNTNGETFCVRYRSAIGEEALYDHLGTWWHQPGPYSDT